VRFTTTTTTAATIALTLGLSLAGFVSTPAHADVTSVDVNIASNAKAGTGCQYKVTANTTGPGLVHFFDNGVQFATASPFNGSASTAWSPKTKGDHELRAGQPKAGFAMVRVSAVDGLNTASGCFALG